MNLLKVKTDLRKRRGQPLGPHTSIRLNAETDARLRDFCLRRGMTVKNVLEAALDHFIPLADAEDAPAAPSTGTLDPVCRVAPGALDL